VVGLLESGDSVLVVVDAQPGFIEASGTAAGVRSEAIVARIAWLAGVAAVLEIPVVVTEEDLSRNGPTAPEVLARLAPGTPPPFRKAVFGLAAEPGILAAIEATGRHTAVVTGFETDVCVAHSALGLLDLGFRVAAVVDATGSPGVMHRHGLRRMRDAGVVLTHAKGLYYEWIRTLEAARAFEADHPDLAEPPGFSL
jgi:nicotinamidase-related amidase